MCASQQDLVDAAELKLGNCSDNEGWTVLGRRGRRVLPATFATSEYSIARKIIFLGMVCDRCVQNNIAVPIA